MDATIHRDGYTVEGNVTCSSSGPGYDAALEAEVTNAWITDAEEFRDAHGDATLEQVMAKEADEIQDALCDDAAVSAAEDGCRSWVRLRAFRGMREVSRG